MINIAASILASALCVLLSTPAATGNWTQQVKDSGIGYHLMSMHHEILEDSIPDRGAQRDTRSIGRAHAIYRPMASTSVLISSKSSVKRKTIQSAPPTVGTQLKKLDASPSEIPDPTAAPNHTPDPYVEEEALVMDNPARPTPAPEETPTMEQTNADVAATSVSDAVVSRPPEPIVPEDIPHQDLPTRVPPTEETVPKAQQAAAEPAAEQEPEGPVFKYYPDIPLAEDLQHVLFDACIENDIPYEVALALIWSESGFNVNSNNGICYGLCALHKYYYPTDLTPEENIKAGMDLLGLYKDRYDGDIEKALDAYANGSFKGTVTTYTQIIMRRAEGFRSFMETH